MPRNTVAPLAARESRSRRTIARWIGTPSCSVGLGGVDHQLLPQRAPVVVGGGQGGGTGQQFAVAFAQLRPLDREKRLPQQRFEFGERVGDLAAGSDRDDHHGHVDVAAEEAGSLPLPVRGAVDAEKD